MTVPSLIPNGRNEPQIPFSTSPFASTGVLHLSSRGRSSIVRRAAPCTCRNQPVRSIRVIPNSIAGGLVGHRPAGATRVHAHDVEHCDVGLSPLAPVSCQLPIRGRPRPPSAAAVVRPTLASLTMPSSSSTAAQAPSQRGVEIGIAALEPCPYVGRERNPADRPAISAACHDPRLGEGWRWPDHPIQVVADPPETAGPPGDVTCTSESFDQRGRSGGSGNRCGTSRDRRLWSRRSRAQSGLGATDASYNSRYASGVSQVPTG